MAIGDLINEEEFQLAWSAGRELEIDGILRHVQGDGLPDSGDTD